MIAGAEARTLQIADRAVPVWEIGEGPLVLLLHGFPDSPHTWRSLAPALAEAGYRVVAPTLRGYAPSAQPKDGDYSMAALVEDVAATLDALSAADCDIVGHDWGASIAAVAAAAYPSKIRSLTLLAVPHPMAFATVAAKDLRQAWRSRYIYYFQLRGLADRALARRDFAMLERLWRAWSPGWNIPAADLEALRATFRQPGVPEAALAYYRQAFDRKHPRLAESAALLVKPVAAPTLGLCGVKDGCVGADVFERAMSAMSATGGVEVARIENAGHFLHLERPDEVAARVIAHLRRHGAKP